MVLAKSLSSLADTQMINKLDHAKSEREKKEEIKKKNKKQRMRKKKNEEEKIKYKGRKKN